MITNGTPPVVIVMILASMTSLSMMSLSQEECDRLKEATINGDVDSIKGILSNGVDVNAAVDSVSKNNITCCVE